MSNIESVIKYYKLCNKLKDTIRKGPIVWNAKRDRIESVADHIFGVQMLAIAMYYQFNYQFDIMKVVFMIAIHELEEIETGDLTFFEADREEKKKMGIEAVNTVLKDFANKETILSLINEYNERATEEARFAYHCDKLECDLQIKLYDQEGCFDMNNQNNNPAMQIEEVQNLVKKEKTFSNAWTEFNRSKYEDDKNFIDIVNYLKENKI